MRKFNFKKFEWENGDTEEARRVRVHGTQINSETPPQKFISNVIITSKYTVLTFLPKNLYGQFRRFANFYFLIVLIIHLNINSPLSPLTSAVPLVIVVAATMLKQGYEDWKHHKMDRNINNTPVIVLRDGELLEIDRQDICVGDVVELEAEEEIPCDMVLITSSDVSKTCDVTTANLDGETHLKTYECCPETADLQDINAISEVKAVIECEPPHRNLYIFKGRFELLDEEDTVIRTSPLSIKNLLLRGAKIKNTECVYGYAVYTGEETKMALNSKMRNSKFSTIEKRLNYFILFYLLILLVEVTLNTVLKYQLFFTPVLKNMWYIGDVILTASFNEIAQDSFSNFILICYLIPISLYVCMEIQMFMCSYFFGWDEKMKCEVTGDSALCNTSDLNEELGQVEYLFSDKTGTLTENLMDFRQCSVYGHKFKEMNGRIMEAAESLESSPYIQLNDQPDLKMFLTCLALCHTIQVTTIKKRLSRSSLRASTISRLSKISNSSKKSRRRSIHNVERVYSGSSPDEKALVEACARFGVVYVKSNDNVITLNICGERLTFTVLDVLEFDSDRKAMSVIIRYDSDDVIWLISKGAESNIIPLCKAVTQEDQDLTNITLQHVTEYAMEGLRTLAVARRAMTTEEYTSFQNDIKLARQDLDDRERKINEVYKNVERDLQLLGATAVEDLLQDGVQETLEALTKAGIKVWVLTGDKIETAVNIAYSCGQFQPSMTVISLTHLKEEEVAIHELQNLLSDLDPNVTYGLVVDGTSLPHLMSHNQAFLQLCLGCTSVVCCRLSPSQKAEIVRLVKTSKNNPICAAIGDGANDVSMIQEANLGIGIFGKEGRQAVHCADFGFGRFKFLQRALLVHGHWYYQRLSVLVQYSFYKNLAFITPQVFFSFWSAFSTQTLFEGSYLSFYNLLFASLPIIVYGLMEQNIPDYTLLSRPELYKTISRNKLMSWKLFLQWGALGLWHAVVMFFGLWLSLSEGVIYGDGKAAGLHLFGLANVSLCVFVVNIKLLLESNYLTMPFVGSIVFSLVVFVAYSLLYTGVIIPFMSNYSVYWVYYRQWESLNILFASILITVLCLLPDFILKIWKVLFIKKARKTKPTKLEDTKPYHDDTTNDDDTDSSNSTNF